MREYRLTGKCHCWKKEFVNGNITPASIIARCKSLIQKKPKQHYLSIFQRNSILTLTAMGYSLDAIGDIIHCDVRTVERWMFRAIEGIDHQPRSGRNCILNEEEKTFIVARAAEDPHVVPAMIKYELDLHCSTRTIDRVMIEAGLFGRVALQSYPYTDAQKQVRLGFCNFILEQVNKDKNFLSRIFFSD